MIRIISGKYKGRRIKAPKKLPVRPTTDMAKEALFNILRHQFHFREVSVLDLFAGSGNISYEFASRGCPDITAVDGNHHCIRFIQETAQAFEFPIQTIKSDVYAFMSRNHHQQYDIVFADPPYDFELEAFEKIANLCFEHQLLSAQGLLVIEHSKHTSLEHLAYFEDTRHYGGNAFSFFSPEMIDDSEE